MALPDQHEDLLKRLERGKTYWREDKQAWEKQARNPDGPEAAKLIRDLAERVERLEGALRTAERCLSGIPKPEVNDGVMVAYSVSDDVPEDIFTALSHIRAALTPEQEKEG